MENNGDLGFTNAMLPLPSTHNSKTLIWVSDMTAEYTQEAGKKYSYFRIDAEQWTLFVLQNR
jgi:hypothetical protein